MKGSDANEDLEAERKGRRRIDVTKTFTERYTTASIASHAVRDGCAAAVNIML